MQKPKKVKLRTLQRPKLTNKLAFINDDRFRLAIPIGPRFQADIPEWTGPPHCLNGGDGESNSSRWLGNRVWPIKGRPGKTKDDAIGRGRPDICMCIHPGSVECVKRHVSDKRLQLQLDLGPAFWRWKFDEMGEEVSSVWNINEEKKFQDIVKMNPISRGKGFLTPALKNLPSHNKGSIVRYYFNVYIPRCMSMKTRSGCKIIDTDDDEVGDFGGKRRPADSVSSFCSKYAKTRYLTGRR